MTKSENPTLRKKSLLSRFFVDNSYCWLAAGCTIGIMILVFYCYSLFPFGEKTILRMDLYHQYGPLFAELYDRIVNGENFFYSWRTGLGSPFLGNFFNYLSSPSLIFMLIFGHENMPEAIATMIVAKAALAAAAFTYYLKKSQDKHDFSTAAFGILYALCGYFIAYYWNVMWIDTMAYFPLVILGIENIINKRSPKLYIPMLALTLLTSYYMGYMTCIFSVLYFLVYYFGNHEVTSVAEDTPYKLDDEGNKVYKFRDKLFGNVFLQSGFTFAFSSIGAACLVAFALIPVYFILKSCSATSGTFPENYNSYFSIFDFLANHLASVDPTIRSSGEDVLPNVYCGMATLILVPLYLFTKSISIKEKTATVALLGILYFSFNINFLNYIWHGFHYPNDLPYRFSFMYSFVLLVIAYKALTRLHEFSGRGILGSGLGVMIAIILIQEIGSKNVEEVTILISLIFVVTYCLVFALMKDSKYQKSAVSVLLLCCIIGELACANTDRYSMNQPKSSFAGDYGEFVTLKEQLDEYDGGNDYRMELVDSRARMDPAWYGFNGVSTFSSMAYEKLSNAQSNLGMFSNFINSYTYHLQTPVYNMMHSLKYIVDNSTDVDLADDYYNKLMTSGKFTAYQNDYYLPIGFTSRKALRLWDTDKTNPFEVQGEWFENATGVSDVFKRMTIDEVRYFQFDEITSGLETGDIYFTKPDTGEGEATFFLTVPEAHHCYLFVDSSAFEEITINKGDTSHVQNISEPYIYDLGIVTPEETVTVLIKVKDKDYGYIDFFPCYVDDEALNKGYEILKEGQLNVTSFDDTKITGTVSAKEDSLFFTSIPYDKGWKVKIDGKEIDEKDYIALEEAYLCFNIPAGNHSIELEFEQRGFVIGLTISVSTAVLMILVAILFAKLRKERKERLYREEIEQVADELLEEVDRQLAEEAAANAETDTPVEVENIVNEPETTPTENDAAPTEATDSDISSETEEKHPEDSDSDTEESDDDFTDEA
ncbi:MAG: YfhO family protein [Clostridia bacterium]|nr:YfhO family protein [Clostridia bacterium]